MKPSCTVLNKRRRGNQWNDIMQNHIIALIWHHVIIIYSANRRNPFAERGLKIITHSWTLLKLRFAYGDHRRAIFAGDDRWCCYPCKWMYLVFLRRSSWGVAFEANSRRSPLAIYVSFYKTLWWWIKISHNTRVRSMTAKQKSFSDFSVCEKDFNFKIQNQIGLQETNEICGKVP